MNDADEMRNPLLDVFAPFIPLPKMPAQLRREPLLDIPWRTMPPNVREQFLELHTEHFFPTAIATDVATRIHAAILGSMRRRNPLSKREQRRINQLSLLQPGDLRLLPSLANPATAGIIAATTGMGKTSIVERTLQVIAPEQFITHARSEVCGWSKLIQICYLKLDFPSNGSRGGIIDRVLGAFDDLIGTEYERRVRRRNLEAGLLEVMKQLSNHRVGALVLDDVQPDTFDLSPWYREVVMFLLCLMNLGIPLVLCGQPGAFTQLVHELQTLRRFSSIGLFNLPRAISKDDIWWVNEFIPGMLRFNLCENVRDVAAITDRARGLSAGIPGYFAQLWIEAQRLALREESMTATLTLQHLEEAVRSPAITTLMQSAANIEAAAEKERHDKSLTNASSGASGASKARYRSPDSTPAAIEKLVRAARSMEKRQQKENERKTTRNAAYSEGLSDDDLRLANHAMDLLTGLDKTQGELSLDGSKSGSDDEHSTSCASTSM